MLYDYVGHDVCSWARRREGKTKRRARARARERDGRQLCGAHCQSHLTDASRVWLRTLSTARAAAAVGVRLLLLLLLVALASPRVTAQLLPDSRTVCQFALDRVDAVDARPTHMFAAAEKTTDLTRYLLAATTTPHRPAPPPLLLQS